MPAEIEHFEFPDLPDGWVQTTMGVVSEVVGGGTPDSKDLSNFARTDGHAWITPADLGGYSSMYISRGKRNLSDKGLRESSAKVMPAGTVLMSSRAPIGYVAIAKNAVSTNQGFKSFVCSDGIRAEFVAFWLGFLRPFLEQMGSGSTFAEISGSRAKEIPLHLAPAAEQTRIVKKVESLLVRVNAACEMLAKVPAILKRFRQSVLAAACSGDLTADWRDKHPHVESASQLLAKVRAARLRRFEEQHLGRTRGVLKHDADDTPEEENLMQLPDIWGLARIGDVFDVYVGATPSRKTRQYWNGKIPWVSSGEVAFCRIRATRECISQEGLQNSSAVVHPPGTVLLAMIGEGKTRGQAAILDIDAAHNQNSASIRVSEAGLVPEYVYYFLEFQYLQTRRRGEGSNQPALNKERVRAITLPIPPLEEQREIVRRVEATFKLSDAIEKRVRAASARAGRLKQSILARAFCGELVATEADLARQQGRNYESASTLVDRIHKRRDQQVAPNGARRKKRAATLQPE